MRDWIDETIARNKKQAKYDRHNTVGLYMKLNTNTDSDIIRWLWNQSSKQGAIKRLIREEIGRENTASDRSPHAPVKQLSPEEIDALT